MTLIFYYLGFVNVSVFIFICLSMSAFFKRMINRGKSPKYTWLILERNFGQRTIYVILNFEPRASSLAQKGLLTGVCRTVNGSGSQKVKIEKNGLWLAISKIRIIIMFWKRKYLDHKISPKWQLSLVTVN